MSKLPLILVHIIDQVKFNKFLDLNQLKFLKENYSKDQIWEYDSGSYFIQATDCLWINIKNNKQSGILSFVSINEDPTDGQYIEITGTKTTYNIFDKSALKLSKINNLISDYLTGKWKRPAKKCISLKNSDIC